MPGFELRLLGPPQVLHDDGTPVDLPLGKPLAALCFLALEATAVRRSDLARILWPSSPDSRARASIRQALWLIRKHTDPAVIVDAGGELRVDSAVLSTDVAAFEADLVSGRLDEALARWRGGPLRGFAIPDAQPWLKWADETRARWEAQLGRALEDRATSASGGNRARWLQRALEVRPFRVSTHLDLIATLVESRDSERAERALSQLGAVAEAEDQEAVREAEARVRLLRRSTYSDPEERLVPEFVGRAREFSKLMEAWRSARRSHPRLVGLTGPRGIGKSALAAEVLRHADVDGGQVLEARAVRTETSIEYGLVATLTSELLRRPGAAGIGAASADVLRRFVPSEGPGLTTPVAPTAVAEALADLLGAVSDEAPLALLVEDVQWIDAPSTPVLLRALRRLRSAPVLMLWTCRDSEAPAGGLSSLRDAAVAGDADLLSLGPLSRAEATEMVTMLLAGGDHPDVDELGWRIHEASAGLPLHAVGLLQRLRDRGVLGRGPDGRWIMADDALTADLDLPDSLETALRDRVSELSDHARALGRRFALADGPRLLPQIRKGSSLTETHAAAGLSELLSRDLVRWTRDDRLHLTHESLVEAFLPPGEGEGRPPDRRGSSRTVATAAVLVAMALGIGWAAQSARSLRPAEAPHGGGTLWLRGIGFAEAYHFTADDRMTRVDSVTVPAGLGIAPLALLKDGSHVWGGFTHSHPTDPPDAVLYAGERLDTVFSSTLEDAVKWLRPQGDAALITVQHPDTQRFRMMVARADLNARPDTTILLAGDASYHPVGWTHDGRGIVLVAQAAVDTLVVVDPGGRRLHTLTPPDPTIAQLQVCGPERLLASSIGDLEPRHWFWTPGDPEVEAWVPSEAVSGPMACSPDGGTVAYLSHVSDRPILLVEALDRGVLVRTDITDRGVLWLTWNAPAGPAPVALRLPHDTIALKRGERDSLGVAALTIDGDAVARKVEWNARDPHIASVDEFGIVVANRRGRTVVQASIDGWLTDSLTVVVTEPDETSPLLFTDSFPTLDLSRWLIEGDSTQPPYSIQTDDGHPALRLTGDGMYTDRLQTRDDFDLSAGATLEARIRFDQLGRRDRQKFRICLMRGEGRGIAASLQERQCLMWPAREGDDFMADAAEFHQLRTRPIAVPLAGLARPGEWTTLAIQLRADGRVFAVVNDSIVAEHPRKLLNRPGDRFYVSIYHAAVDTELLLRDITLWSEERYR